MLKKVACLLIVFAFVFSIFAEHGSGGGDTFHWICTGGGEPDWDGTNSCEDCVDRTSVPEGRQCLYRCEIGAGQIDCATQTCTTHECID